MIKLKVRDVAEEKGWSAYMLVRATRLSSRALYAIWNGETVDPGIQTLGAIARALKVEVCQLIEEDGVEPVIGPRESEDGPGSEEELAGSLIAGPSSLGIDALGVVAA
jgi:transcriptional regulator with XRE-family HTH domain